MVLQRYYGPPGSNNRFRALKPSALERELNFKENHVIFGDPGQVTKICLLQKTESKLFLYLVTKYWYV